MLGLGLGLGYLLIQIRVADEISTNNYTANSSFTVWRCTSMEELTHLIKTGEGPDEKAYANLTLSLTGTLKL